MRHPNDEDKRDRKKVRDAVDVLKRAEASFQKKVWHLLDFNELEVARQISERIELLSPQQKEPKL